LKLPGKDATPEDWKSYYKAIGAPDSADAYELPVPEGQDAAFSKTAAAWMAETGLLPHQAKALAERWNAYNGELSKQAQEVEQQAQAKREADTAKQINDLKTEWGQGHDQNMEMARRAVSQFFPKERAGDIIEAIESKLGYSATIKIMHAIGKGLGEGNARGLGEGPGNHGPVNTADKLFGDALAKAFPG
jgi:hypothetical protein